MKPRAALSAEKVAATCLGKLPFVSPADAWRARRRKKGMIHYRCPACGLYHTAPKRKKPWR